MQNKWITKKTIKISIVIFVILSPIILAVLSYFYDKYTPLLALCEYIITIPLGIYSINKIKKASSKSSVIIIAIIDLLMLFIVPGLLILLSSTKIYKKDEYNGNPDYRKAIEHDTIIDYNEEDENEW